MSAWILAVALAVNTASETELERRGFLQCGGYLITAELKIDLGLVKDAAIDVSDAKHCSTGKLAQAISAAGNNAALTEAAKSMHLKLVVYADAMLPEIGDTNATYAIRVQPLKASFEEAQERYKMERDLAAQR